MSDAFDPYYTWLGIPPDEQPPNHYRLLGLRAFEENIEAIHNAADRQMAYLRTFQTGPNSASSQRLLNEVAAARVCLCDPWKKPAYDAALRQRVKPSASQADPGLKGFLDKLPQAQPVHPTASNRAGKRSKFDLNRWLLGGFGVVGAMLLLAALLRSSASDAPEPGRDTTRPAKQARIKVDHPKEPVPDDLAAPMAQSAQSPGPLVEPVRDPDLPVEPAGPAVPETAQLPRETQPPVPSEPRAEPPREPESKPDPQPEQVAMPAPAAPPKETEAAAEPVQKHPVPDEAARAKALSTIKELFRQEYAANQASARLALAARLVRQTRQAASQPVEQYVMLTEAKSLAERYGECPLALLAVEELARRFEVPAGEMQRVVLSGTVRYARTPLAAAVLVESALTAAEASLACGEYEEWTTLLGQFKALAKKGSPQISQMLEQGQNRLEALHELCPSSAEAAAAVEADPNDAAANLRLGLLEGLAKGDWDLALPRLAKGGQPFLAPPAAILAVQRDDVGAQIALADAWWDLAEKERETRKALYRAAAQYWYGQALPRLAGQDSARVEARLLAADEAGAETQAKGPFTIPLHGLGGLPAMLPVKVTGKAVSTEEFANLQGTCRLAYPQVPASSYVQHVELTLAAAAGAVEMIYGDPYLGVNVRLAWEDEKKKFRCRMHTYRGGTVYWGGDQWYDPKTRIRLTVYVSENRQALYEGDRRLLGSKSRPADLHFRFHTGEQTAVSVHRCQFRRWMSADSQRLGWPPPPSRVESNWGETALRLHERNLGLDDRPLPAGKAPYVIASTGTAMQWIEPGKFERPSGKDGKKSTEVTLTRGFWISRYEITQAEWAALVPVKPSRVVGSPFLPVDGASYEEAVKYCVLLGQQESRSRRVPAGYVYRLPTEAEWEHACRAGSREPFSVEPDGFWSAETSDFRPHEVGEGKPNAWGLYDMHGNISELCLDAWQEEPAEPVWRLADPFSPPKAAKGMFPVRGGAWWSGRDACASHAREASVSIPGGHRGFRIVLGPVL